MRLKHVNVRVLLSSLLAVLALSAVAASAAQASAEGPFLKVGGSRLTEGQSKEVTAASKSFTVSDEEFGLNFTCTGVKVASGAKLLGFDWRELLRRRSDARILGLCPGDRGERYEMQDRERHVQDRAAQNGAGI